MAQWSDNDPEPIQEQPVQTSTAYVGDMIDVPQPATIAWGCLFAVIGAGSIVALLVWAVVGRTG